MHLTDKDAPIFVAGHRGLVGSAVVRALEAHGYTNVLVRSRAEVDLLNADAVRAFFEAERPAFVVLAAAKVGGILANSTYPADFIGQNLQIQQNVITSAYETGVQRFVFLGSSCIYPKMAPQPIKEEHLLTGPLEPTNEWYAIAKIAGLKMCEAYHRQYGWDAVSMMPTNLYGINDNFDLKNSHVLPALMRKFHEAKLRGDASVPVWGSGTPKREFLYADDLADAVHFILTTPEDVIRANAPDGLINTGTGEDLTIAELAEMVRTSVGFEGTIAYDASKPDGTPRKVMDVSRLRGMGWAPKTSLEEGIAKMYAWYLAQQG